MQPFRSLSVGRWALTLAAALMLALPGHAGPPAAPKPTQGDGTVMLTIFFRHDQTKTLEEINAQLDRTGFRKSFPPEGVEVVSWYVMMGVGQVVTLRFPPEKLRTVNLAIEKGAWGAFRTEMYATYDYRPVWQELRNAK
ncbi:hypothetical protein COCOR_01672 [Corallococcus coralloides DSM 2259]|uniref:Lipoprotein n=1 Tax=Corallococcus coralloides (strain ATCC 25202 / DSM 2259 / NBRC 100086 / M2) TaxID=1144275 RepID=H8N008_CORCM|nr:hypothetical protein [Corallococcus coralloides]AFE04210.1 hypothetical protein COCOR_01672 [Corallococcus coralloides DSM 2259]